MENLLPQGPEPIAGHAAAPRVFPVEIIGLVILSFVLAAAVLIPRVIYLKNLAPAPLDKAEEMLSYLFDSTKNIHHLAKKDFSQKPAPAAPKPLQPVTAAVPAAAAAVAAQPVLNLEGIIFDPDGNSQVLINGQIYTVGSMLPGGYKITAITEDRVLLLWGTQKYTLSNKSGLRKERSPGAVRAAA